MAKWFCDSVAMQLGKGHTLSLYFIGKFPFMSKSRILHFIILHTSSGDKQDPGLKYSWIWDMSKSISLPLLNFDLSLINLANEARSQAFLTKDLNFTLENDSISSNVKLIWQSIKSCHTKLEKSPLIGDLSCSRNTFFAIDESSDFINEYK